jgi:hypothetical protein
VGGATNPTALSPMRRTGQCKITRGIGHEGSEGLFRYLMMHLQDCLNLKYDVGISHGDSWASPSAKRWNKLNKEGGLTYENKLLAIIDLRRQRAR